MFETVVIDDLIPEADQHRLHSHIMNNAKWQFLTDVSGVEGHMWPSHGFAHILKDPKTNNFSDLYGDIAVTILSRLAHIEGWSNVYYNRIFLQLPLPEQYRKEHNGVHVDLPADLPHIAAVYYVNNSDGDTIIYDQTINDTPGGSQDVQLTEHMRVKPKRGRIVLFDGSRYHCSSQPTVNYRCIINFDLVV
jgi:hypothetical protein